MNVLSLRIAALAAVALPALSLAQAAGLTAPEVSALVRSLPQGAEFRSDRQTYRPVAGLRVEVRARGDGSQAMQAPVGVAGDLVEVKGPYAIYRDSSSATPSGAARTAAPRVTEGSAVVNVRTGQLGIVDGTITAKLSDVAAAKALAAANGLTVEFVAERIGYAFFRAAPGRDLAAAAAALSRDPRVLSAFPTVTENFPTAG